MLPSSNATSLSAASPRCQATIPADTASKTTNPTNRTTGCNNRPWPSATLVSRFIKYKPVATAALIMASVSRNCKTRSKVNNLLDLLRPCQIDRHCVTVSEPDKPTCDGLCRVEEQYQQRHRYTFCCRTT